MQGTASLAVSCILKQFENWKVNWRIAVAACRVIQAVPDKQYRATDAKWLEDNVNDLIVEMNRRLEHSIADADLSETGNKIASG